MKNISIVLGYGVFTPEQTDYQNYLVTALNGCLKDQSEIILTTGGCSNKNYPQLSEAESVKNLYLELHPELSPIIIAENHSLSTPQNLEFCQKIIATDYPDSNSITIYCDSCRAPKVLYLSLSLFLKNQNLSEKDKIIILASIYFTQKFDASQNLVLKHKNITVVGIPFSQTKELIAHQIMSSMLEMHAFDYPELHQQFIDWRKFKWGVK